MGEPYNEPSKRKRGGIDHTLTQYTEPPVHPKEQRNESPQTQGGHENSQADPEYGPDHASRAMSAMRLDIETVSRHSRSATRVQERDASPTCFGQGNVSVPITELQLTIGAVCCSCVDKATGATVPRRVPKALLTSTQHPGYCYDLDVAVLTKWHLVKRACPLSPLYRQQNAQTLLVIRKDFLAHKVGDGAGGLVAVYPHTIQINGAPWYIHYCVGDTRYCYAFEGAVPFRLAKRTFPVRDLGSAVEPASTSTLLMIVPGEPQNPLTSDAGDQEFCATWGIEVPAGFSFPSVGFSLWKPPYGEVYRGHKLPASTLPGASAIDFDIAGGEEVAVKVVRHQNDNVPGAELNWYYESGQRYGSKLIHHDAPAGAALTTGHLAAHFQAEARRGRNENLVNEIETMDFIARAVEEAITGDSVKLPGSQDSGKQVDQAESGAVGLGAADLTHLRSRFLPHVEVALSSDNLFIVTQYAPFGSLSFYISREQARNPKLSERCVRHVLRHLLQALCFLHERGLAHQDISLENAVLLVPGTPENAELRRRSKEFLSEEDFLRLEVVLIDMGHMGIHQRIADPSLQHSLLNSSNITVNTATTCESNVSDPCPCLDCAGVHSRAGSMDSTSGMDISTTDAVPPTLGRKFKRRAMPKFPLGKRPYQPPEICEVLNALPYEAGQEYCGMHLDMWQLGVLALYMLTGRPPYEHFDSPSSEGGSMLRKEMTWFMSVQQGQLRNRPVTFRDADDLVTIAPLHSKISPQGMQLLERLLQYNPEDRITAKAALEDPWFSM